MNFRFAFKCVMLVDDSEIDNWLAELLIRRTGLAENVLIFHSAQEALHHLKNSHSKTELYAAPEVIFLDIAMPVMSGFEFLEKYEELELPEIKIYILSASVLAADKDEARHYASVHGYIHKPLTETLLLGLKNSKR